MADNARMPHRHWTRDQLLLAFRLYCRTPFGRLHRHNPEIVALARVIGRTANAVAMKACNFASLDPAQRERGVKGLSNLSTADRELWAEFSTDSEAVAAEAESVHDRMAGAIPPPNADGEIELPDGPSQVARVVQVRRVQGFFRATVLSSYENRCALTGLAVPALLNASHIIPWADDAQRRADPRNGLCLNALHDRAFDRGLVTFDEQWRLVLSPSLPEDNASPMQRQTLHDLQGARLCLPSRFRPDPAAMAYHRERVFRSLPQ